MSFRRRIWLTVAIFAFLLFAAAAVRLFVMAGGAVPVGAACHC